MITWIKDILPILGIGVIFGTLYELVLWLSEWLNKESQLPKKSEKIIKLDETHPIKKHKSIA